jgi:hypothetical protein
MKIKASTILTTLSLSVLLMLPAFFYYLKWGIGFWSEHEDWSIMATYFSGFYGPMFTGISIVFVALQIKSTNDENRKIKLSNEFEMLLMNLNEQLATTDREHIHKITKEVATSIKEGIEPALGELSFGFYNNKSLLFHAVAGIILTLNSMRDLDEERFITLRTILFSLVERDLFSKLESIAQSFRITSKCICKENEKVNK